MRSFHAEYKKEIFIGLLMIAIAVTLRVGRILFYRQPVFADEAIYIRWAQVMQAESGLRFLPLSDGKQPLFMWVLIPFFRVFSDPLFAGRFLSVLTGISTLIGIFLLTFILFKTAKNSRSSERSDSLVGIFNIFKDDSGIVRVASITSLIYAISPFAVFFDSMALVDSMLSMFGVWILFLSILTVKLRRFDLAMITGFTLGGALLTKSPGVYFAFLLPTTFLFSVFPKELKKKVLHLIKLTILFIPVYLIGFGMYNILRLGTNFHMLGSRNRDYIFPLSHILERPLDPLLPFLDRTLEWFWIWGPALFIFFVVFGIILNFRKYTKEIFVLSVWAFIPLFASAELARVFTARYVFYIIPPLTVIAGSLFLNEQYKRLFRLLLGVFALHALYINFLLIVNIEKAPFPRSERSGYLEEWTAGQGIKETSEILKSYHTQFSERKVIVGTEGYFGTLPDGLQMYLNRYPEITVIGVGIDLKELPNSLKESRDAGNATFLVINDSRLLVKPEKIGLKLIAVYPKALREPKTAEYNIHGPQENLLLFEVE